MFDKIKSEGGFTRFLISKVYYGEQLTETLAAYDKMVQEKEFKAANRKSFIQRIKERKEELMARKERDEYLESLYTAADFLKSIDGIERDVYNIDGHDTIVKFAQKEDLRDMKLESYKKNLTKKDIIRKDFNTHPMFVQLNNTYTKIVSAKVYEDNEIILDCSPEESKIHEYIILAL